MEPSKLAFFIRLTVSALFGIFFSGNIHESLFQNTIYFIGILVLFFTVGTLSFLMLKTVKHDWYRAWPMPCSVGFLVGTLFVSIRIYPSHTTVILVLLSSLLLGYCFGLLVNKPARQKLFKKPTT